MVAGLCGVVPGASGCAVHPFPGPARSRRRTPHGRYQPSARRSGGQLHTPSGGPLRSTLAACARWLAPATATAPYGGNYGPAHSRRSTAAGAHRRAPAPVLEKLRHREAGNDTRAGVVRPRRAAPPAGDHQSPQFLVTDRGSNSPDRPRRPKTTVDSALVGTNTRLRCPHGHYQPPGPAPPGPRIRHRQKEPQPKPLPAAIPTRRNPPSHPHTHHPRASTPQTRNPGPRKQPTHPPPPDFNAPPGAGGARPEGPVVAPARARSCLPQERTTAHTPRPLTTMVRHRGIAAPTISSAAGAPGVGGVRR